MTLLDTRKQEVLNKVAALKEKVKTLWPHAAHIQPALDRIVVKFDLRGAAAGIASTRGGVYALRFNTDMMQNEAWNHLFTDTVPHELAHLVGHFMGYGMNHGREWRTICIRLGGTGKRCHNERIQYAKGATFQYTTATGRSVVISQTRHKRIQQEGAVYRWNDGSRIDKACVYKKVA